MDRHPGVPWIRHRGPWRFGVLPRRTVVVQRHPMQDQADHVATDFRRLFRGDRFRFEFGIRPADRDWFRLDGGNRSTLRDRRPLLERQPDRHLPWSGSADPVFEELVDLFGATPGIRVPGGAREQAKALAGLWEPDFVLMRREDSVFRMVGACVCDPSWWDPGSKLGKPIEEIHAPVPTLNETLGDRIRTFLERLPVGVTLVRENWGLAAVPDRNLHPALDRPRLGPESRAATTWLRVEHQAFRALPSTGGVAFLIALTVHPVAELMRDPDLARAVRGHLESMPPEIARYKGLDGIGPDFWDDVV